MSLFYKKNIFLAVFVSLDTFIGLTFFNAIKLSLLFSYFTQWACAVKHKGFVMYGKWTDCVISWCLYYCQSLAWTNTLAYKVICTFQIHNVLQ
jgi:hypothetical protein